MATARARLYILDDSSNVTYAGNSSNGVFVWGAQLELEQHFADAQQNFNNFRYIRTFGVTQSVTGQRYRLDSSTDSFALTDVLRSVLNRNLGDLDQILTMEDSIDLELSTPIQVLDYMVLTGSEDYESGSGVEDWL